MKTHARCTPRSLIAASALALSACAHYAEVRPIVIGPYADRDAALFEQIETAARSQGYPVLDSDVARGLVILEAHARTRGGAPTLAVQCYRRGWVRLVPGGPGVRPEVDHFVVPAALRPEMESFAVRLRESLESAR